MLLKKNNFLLSLRTPTVNQQVPGWVDYVQWSGPSPQLDEWQKNEYKHDLYGRRSEKKVDGFSTRYLYDGPHVIAEYDGNNNLLRKYIYGPGIDQPVCMIEEAESETYYYHFDGLGSVVALSDSAGDTVQTYEYSVFGQVAVEDINHPNPYMFAGRRFDIEIGLYYNRARYCNPYTGRFLQVDPIGYGDGMNMYAYCGNNPIGFVDPSGLTSWGLNYGRWYDDGPLFFMWTELESYYATHYPEMENWYEHARMSWAYVVECSEFERGDVEAAFQQLDETDCGRALIDSSLADWSNCTAWRGIVIQVSPGLVREGSDPPVALGGRYDPESNTIYWEPVGDYYQPAWIFLGHEMIHADHLLDIPHRYSSPPTAWDKIHEEALTLGVNIVDINGNRIATFRGDPYAPYSVSALYAQAGLENPYKDIIWNPPEDICPRHGTPRGSCPVPH